MALWLAMLPALAPAATLHIVGENLPPSSMMVGKTVGGRETDKVRAILERARIAYTVELLPWKRALYQAQTVPGTCLYAATRTPEREALFHWIGPLNEGAWVLYGLASRGLQLATLDDARSYVIGTVVGDARDAYLRERGFQVSAVTDEWINPRKLLLGRIDLWAVSVSNNTAPFAGREWESQVVPLLTFRHAQTYLACHRAVPAAQVAAMQAALAALRRDGSIARIDSAY